MHPYRQRPEGVPRSPEPRWKRSLIALLGVFFPIVVLALELEEGLCREVLFDPLPSGWHVGLVALVPVANALALFAPPRFGWWLRALNGAALVVTLVYSLMFLPLMPLALLAVMVYGLGLLALSPAFALLATVFARRSITSRAHFDPAPRFAPGLVGALVTSLLFAGAALPNVFTQVALRRALSDDAAVARQGRQSLRRLASTDALLATCAREIGRNKASPLTLGFLFRDAVPAERAAEVFYRVTGKVCATREAGRGGLLGGRGFATLAEELEGPADGAHLKLATSQLAGSVDAGAAVGYLEWTLVFENGSSFQEEATAELELPKGAVISRATLWIDGEPREAAFASRAKARAAYERVVSRRKDPLLVTSTSRGRAQIRCFPVPPRGQMKILLGITVPLAVEEPGTAWLNLPSILRRNFALPAAHRLALEAEQPFSLDGAAARSAGGSWALDQSLPALGLAPSHARLMFDRKGAGADSWSPDLADPGQVVTQRLEPYREARRERVSIVVDASLRQEPAVTALRAALGELAPGTLLSVFVASDAGVIELVADRRFDPQLAKEVDAALSELEFAGGTDSVPALIRAVDHVHERDHAAVLWLHGPQPYVFQDPEPVRYTLDRARRFDLRLVELQTTPGRHRVLDELAGAHGLSTSARRETLEATLRAQFAEWGGALRYRPVRRLDPRLLPPLAPSGHQTSTHLSRLWAFEEIEELAARQRDAQALSLATSYKLVTTVSGAVVLETAAQYAEAGLVPPTGENVPSVPEPAFWVLIGCTLGLLGVVVLIGRSARQREAACA